MAGERCDEFPLAASQAVRSRKRRWLTSDVGFGCACGVSCGPPCGDRCPGGELPFTPPHDSNPKRFQKKDTIVAHLSRDKPRSFIRTDLHYGGGACIFATSCRKSSRFRIGSKSGFSLNFFLSL